MLYVGSHAFLISNRMKGIYVLTNYLWIYEKRQIRTFLDKNQKLMKLFL